MHNCYGVCGEFLWSTLDSQGSKMQLVYLPISLDAGKITACIPPNLRVVRFGFVKWVKETHGTV